MAHCRAGRPRHPGAAILGHWIRDLGEHLGAGVRWCAAPINAISANISVQVSQSAVLFLCVGKKDDCGYVPRIELELGFASTSSVKYVKYGTDGWVRRIALAISSSESRE